ncbi:uracil-DNA glycosylase family protein [Brevibacterium sp. ZH18]|uniref:uracil-DNA glycosylase family protein n=1 Tax=Brevibacterium sp. ZH18 TaxID=2927784 RepID=UPI00325C173A
MSPTAPLGSESRLPAAWRPWRRPSPLAGARPTPAQLAAAADGPARDDVLPLPGDAESAGLVRLLIVGINPSPWTTAVNAPFARPGNRFWPSLAAAVILPRTVDASRGLSPDDERLLAERGIGIANLVGRTTARAAQLMRMPHVSSQSSRRGMLTASTTSPAGRGGAGKPGGRRRRCRWRAPRRGCGSGPGRSGWNRGPQRRGGAAARRGRAAGTRARRPR